MERKYQCELGIMALGILALGILALSILSCNQSEVWFLVLREIRSIEISFDLGTVGFLQLLLV